MENGGQTHLPKDQPVVIGELPWQLLGDSNRRLLVLACSSRDRRARGDHGARCSDRGGRQRDGAAGALAVPEPRCPECDGPQTFKAGGFPDPDAPASAAGELGAG